MLKKRGILCILIIVTGTLITACTVRNDANESSTTGTSQGYSSTLPQTSSVGISSNTAINNSTTNAESLDQNSADKSESDIKDHYPAMVESGSMTFHSSKTGIDVKLPLYAVDVTYGTDPDLGLVHSIVPESISHGISYTIPAGQEDQLAVYWMNLSQAGTQSLTLLAPRGWRPVEAIVGANGSYVLSLENPKDPSETLRYYDTAGGCQGCAISSIGTYFPALQKWAEDQSFPGDKMDFQKQTVLSEHLISYTKKHTDPHYEINGVAYEEHEPGNARFQREEMSSISDKHPLTETVLNFFIQAFNDTQSGN